MNKYISRLIILSVFAIFGITGMSSCKKHHDAVNSFTWTYGTTGYTAHFNAAYSESVTGTPIIIAGTGTTVSAAGVGPRIYLSSFSSGTHNFSGTEEALLYVDENGDSQVATSGSVQLDASDNLLSGEFTAGLSNGVSLTGKFSNVPVNQ